VDLLTTFEVEVLARHALSVVSGGGIVYDVKDADTPLERITFLDDRIKDDFKTYLEERNLPPTTAGLLQDARGRGVQTFPVSFDRITSALAQKLEVPKAIAERTLNTIAVAISCALLDYDSAYLKKALERQFHTRPKIVNMNVKAVELAYDFVRNNLSTKDFNFRIVPLKTTEHSLFVNGNQAVAMGKIAAGMTFQTYYPISPATDESVYLEAHETFPTEGGEEGSVVVVQTEDEISAVAMALGAALTGARSATATSGPGFSLMAEGLGWAGINEVPLVVTIYQRGSPATGMPTRTEQGDLQFAIHAGHGEFPRIIITSGDLTEAFYDAAAAFNYAERYQMVVIHLLDKALSSTTQTVAPFKTDSIHIERGAVYKPHEAGNGRTPYPRFAPTESGVSPRALLGQPGGIHWLTGGEHTQYGRVTEDPGIREEQMEKRARKLELVAREIPPEEKLKVYGDPEASFTILTWGSNKGAIVEALQLLAADGIRARLVQVRLLWPFPAEEIASLIEGASPVVVVEANFSGQFAQLLREHTGRAHDYLVVKYNGRPMSGQELSRAFRAVHEGVQDRRIVLRNPYES
jgi:2-oxoglutarate ferredoxin oxidoreductase subunit alpha